jgi:hypothetical protein
LHLDVSTLQMPLLHLDVSTPQGPELHLDVSTPQRPLLHLEVSVQQSLEVCSLGDIRNSAHGNYHGIPRNFVQLCDTEFRKILGNFAQNTEVTEVQKPDGIPCWQNSVHTLAVGPGDCGEYL